MQKFLSLFLYYIGHFISIFLYYDLLSFLYPLYKKVMILSSDLDKYEKVWKNVNHDENI